MDKIQKFLLKLTKKELEQVSLILEKILKRDLDELDYKKLKTEEWLYRARKGDIRILFKKNGNSWLLVNIDYRGNIYKKI